MTQSGAQGHWRTKKQHPKILEITQVHIEDVELQDYSQVK